MVMLFSGLSVVLAVPTAAIAIDPDSIHRPAIGYGSINYKPIDHGSIDHGSTDRQSNDSAISDAIDRDVWLWAQSLDFRGLPVTAEAIAAHTPYPITAIRQTLARFGWPPQA